MEILIVMLNKQRILSEVTQIIDEQLTEEELEVVEIMESLYYSNKSWEFVANVYLEKMVEFTLYLIECEKDEKYEICQLVKDAIDIVTNDMVRIAIKYFEVNEETQESVSTTPKVLFNSLYNVVMEDEEYNKWANNIYDYEEDEDDYDD
jgi:hypothetical protein